VADPVHQADRAYESRIDLADRVVIAALIELAWAAGNSVDYAFATAWDAGIMIASKRSWWRIAGDLDQARRPAAPTRGTGTSKKRATPVVVATGPNQVWSWDITDLKSPYARKTFKAYSVIDIYSRMIIAWRVADREDKSLVNEMFSQAIEAYGPPGIVHADNGAVMKSNDLQNLLSDHGVQMSHNRPYVSNDNPYSESEFRTMKYRPDYPGVFDSLEDARTFLRSYVPWYNTCHKHSGIELFSPQDVFDGTWKIKHQLRDDALQRYFDRHPERFRGRPRTRKPAEVVGINHRQEAKV
jgi:putative transposase